MSATANHDFDQCKATLRDNRAEMLDSGNIALLNCFPIKNGAVYLPFYFYAATSLLALHQFVKF